MGGVVKRIIPGPQKLDYISVYTVTSEYANGQVMYGCYCFEHVGVFFCDKNLPTFGQRVGLL